MITEKTNLITPDEAQRLGFAISKDDLAYGDNEFHEPKNYGIAYKVFYLGKDGKLYPPVILSLRTPFLILYQLPWTKYLVVESLT